MFIKVNKSRKVTWVWYVAHIRLTSIGGRLLEYAKYVEQMGCEDVKQWMKVPQDKSDGNKF